MNGILHKTKKGEWYVSFENKSLPVLSIEFDMSKPASLLTEGKEVEFEIDELIDITPDGTEIIKYAKLINY